MGLRQRIERALSSASFDSDTTPNQDDSQIEHRRVLSAVLSEVDARLCDPNSVPVEALQPWQIRRELAARERRIYDEELICIALHNRLYELTPYEGPTRWQMREE